MELVDGVSILEHLRPGYRVRVAERDRVPSSLSSHGELVAVFRQLATAIAAELHPHGKTLEHPGCESNGTLGVVLDFRSRRGRAGLARLDKLGNFVEMCLSPQAGGAAAGKWSDWYSFGVVLFKRSPVVSVLGRVAAGAG